MPDEPKSPLSAFTEHAKAIFGIAAALAGAVFGTAHWAFYEQLDVRPSDVGLGPAEILAQAAVGLVLAALFFAVVGAVSTVAYWAGWTMTGATPMNWELGIAMGVIGGAGLSGGTVAAVGAALVSDGSWAVAVVIAVLGLVVWLTVQGWRDQRQVDHRPLDRARVAVLAALGFGVFVAPMAGLVAIDDARNVRRGVVTMSVLHPLAGGPVTCVEPNPSKAGTSYLLHLGTGDTHEVLYRPGHGPVRVPAGDVVLLPAEPSKCRPSR